MENFFDQFDTEAPLSGQSTSSHDNQKTPPDQINGTQNTPPNFFDQFDASQAQAHPSVNQKDITPLQVPEMFQDKPGMYYGTWPVARNEETGETSLAWPEPIRSAARGLVGLMNRSAGFYPVEDENERGGPLAPLSTDELGALAMMSPTSAASAARNVPEVAADTLSAAGKQAGKTLAPVGEGAKTVWAGLRAPDAAMLKEMAADDRSAAGALFNQMRDNGAVFGPMRSAAIKDAVNNAVNNPKFIPEMNPKTLGIVKKLNEVVDQNGSIDLDTLHQYRTLLSRIGATEDGVSAGAVRRAINDQVYGPISQADLVNGTPEALNLLQKGTAAYARASRAEDIAEVLMRANGNPNRIKALMSNYMNSKDFQRAGYNQAEKSMIKRAADTGVAENIFKAFGKAGFGFDKSGTGNTVLPAMLSGAAGGVGALFGGTSGAAAAGAPLAVVGTGARALQTYLARGKAQQAYDFIANRPLPGEARGGRIKTHAGKVVKKPVSYPALEAMRKKS